MNKFKYLFLIVSFVLSFNSFQVASAAYNKNDYDDTSYEEDDHEDAVKESKDEDEDY